MTDSSVLRLLQRRKRIVLFQRHESAKGWVFFLLLVYAFLFIFFFFWFMLFNSSVLLSNIQISSIFLLLLVLNIPFLSQKKVNTFTPNGAN